MQEACGAARPEEYGCAVEGLSGVVRTLSVRGGSCFLKVAKKAGTKYASLRQNQYQWNFLRCTSRSR